MQQNTFLHKPWKRLLACAVSDLSLVLASFTFSLFSFLTFPPIAYRPHPPFPSLVLTPQPSPFPISPPQAAHRAGLKDTAWFCHQKRLSVWSLQDLLEKIVFCKMQWGICDRKNQEIVNYGSVSDNLETVQASSCFQSSGKSPCSIQEQTEHISDYPCTRKPSSFLPVPLLSLAHPFCLFSTRLFTCGTQVYTWLF